MGSIRALADGLGIRPESVYSWKKVPPARVAALSELTKIPREQLRPDLFEKGSV